jgi:hypothetical protein
MEPGQKGPITYRNNLRHFYLVLHHSQFRGNENYSSSLLVMITSIETLNIPGMAAFSHDASWAIGLFELCMNSDLKGIYDGQSSKSVFIYQKDSCSDTSL